MKKYILIISLLGLLLVGCQETTMFPVEEESNTISLDNSLNKGNDDDLQYVYDLGDIKDFKVKASKNFKIKGKKGGKIELKVEWKYKNGQKVKLEAKLEIPKNAYNDELEFDMIFNLHEYNLELYPSPFTFDKPVVLDLKFENIDIDLFTDQNINFSYIDGLSETVDFQEVKLDKNKKKIEVKGAKLKHFSRYGWTRRR